MELGLVVMPLLPSPQGELVEEPVEFECRDGQRLRLPPALALAIRRWLEHASTVAPAAVEPLPVPPRMSKRERDVLAGLVDGQSYKQIAYELDISMDTVRTYIRRLYRKLGVHSAVEAVTLAHRTGLAR